MDNSQFISVIIPYRKKSEYLLECLHHLEKITHPSFEVILLPDDKEGNIVFSKPFTEIPTGPVGPAQKRDLACKKAQGSIFAFIDDDAYPDSAWLSQAVCHFQNEQIAAVTGPAVTPDSDHWLQKASGLIYSTPLSSGPITHRYRPEKCREIDDAASVNMIVRRSDYEAVGGFNTHYYPGEDTKLCLDFIKVRQKKIIYDPQVLVFHHRRSLFLPHLKQVSQYALHRGFFAKRFPKNSLKIKYFLPSFFSLYVLSLLIMAQFHAMWALYISIPLISYCILLTGSLMKVHKLKESLAASLGCLLTHFTYGVYFMKGMLSSNLKR